MGTVSSLSSSSEAGFELFWLIRTERTGQVSDSSGRLLARCTSGFTFFSRLRTCCSDKFEIFVSVGFSNDVDLRLTRKIPDSESELSLHSMAEALHEPRLQASSTPHEISSIA
jgi:hypothetical protein